jgi:hypothetical protein
MVFPMKKLTASAANGGHQQHPSESLSKEVAASASEDMNTEDETESAEPANATAPPVAARSGLDLLFDASSKVEAKPKEAIGGEVPSAITAVTNGTGTAESESEMGGPSGSIASASSSEYDAAENPTTNSFKNQCKCKTFPQLLHEILNSPEYQSIAHWLPDGSSFIIADKERFSDEILPKHFRVALFESFVRKLNRYRFRRVKSRCKGEESSFAHNNFVRDKPWLCLKMNCKSKPSYHKDSANKQSAASEAVNSLSNVARIAVPSQFPPPPSFLLSAAGGIVDANRDFVPTYLPATSTFYTANAAAANTGSHTAAAVPNTIQEMQQYPPEQCIFRERQILMFQMRQRHLLQMQLQRLDDMSAHNVDEHFASSYVQMSMMEQQYRRDLLLRNIGER